VSVKLVRCILISTTPFAEDDEDDALDDEDLELLNENTGSNFKGRLTRLRRGGDSPSPGPSSSKRRVVVESSDDDLDDDLDLPQVQDIQRIWDDERAGGRDDEDDLDDMDNFIDYEEEEGGVGAMNEDEREERRRERRRLEKERRKATGARPELAGIDAK
jgi:transcription elongation factor SPT6